MNYFSIIWVLIVATLSVGCSTGTYLRPDSVAGHYTTVNPSCPGAPEVIEYSPENQSWVSFRVYATPPGRHSSQGTELRIDVRVSPRVGIESTLSYIFQNEETEKLIKERRNTAYLLTASEPMVTVIMPDGKKQKISIPMFKKPFDAKNNQNSYWAPGVQLSSGKLDNFSIEFPDIYVNGEKINLQLISFKLDQGRYAPVLNC